MHSRFRNRQIYVGELVLQDLDDKPASVLLERIKKERAELKEKKTRKRKSKTLPDFN